MGEEELVWDPGGNVYVKIVGIKNHAESLATNRPAQNAGVR